MSLTESTPPLQTITETFSTKELILKTSVLPVVINGKTKHHTLTHSYYVTRLLEAVKVRHFTYPKIGHHLKKILSVPTKWII